MITVVIFLVIAYLIGSLSSAILVCKQMGLPDPRTQGSGNPGTTNVLRIGGKMPALLTLLGDVLKGFLPVMIASLFNINGFYLGLIAIAALLGHLFPAFFKFKGGKGVATAFGALLALSFPVAIGAAIAWVAIAVVTRYSSLASLLAAAVAPILALILGKWVLIVPILIISGLIAWRHLENIKRLQAGTENKINL